MTPDSALCAPIVLTRPLASTHAVIRQHQTELPQISELSARFLSYETLTATGIVRCQSYGLGPQLVGL